MRARSLIVAGVILCGLLATLVAPAPGRAQSRGIYIALGDSVAYGIGSSLPRTRSYPALLHGWMESWAATPVLHTNLAQSGETTRSFIDDGQLDEFRNEVQLARDAGIPILAVSLTLGGNDILTLQDAGVTDRNQALEQFRADFPAALSQVREVIGGDVPLAVTTYYDPTTGDPTLPNTDSWWIARFNDVIADSADAQGAILVDLAAAFTEADGELTRYPVDVHPTNAGHLTIARAMWTGLGFDNEPPQIDVDPALEASRRTPTIQFNAGDNAALRSIALSISNGAVSEPVPLGEGEYVALADLRGVDGSSFEVVISAVDEAGNVSDETLQLEITG